MHAAQQSDSTAPAGSRRVAAEQHPAVCASAPLPKLASSCLPIPDYGTKGHLSGSLIAPDCPQMCVRHVLNPAWLPACSQIPRFAFEKFPGAKAELTTQMKSVGEAMAMGRTFQESFQKALRSLETGCDGWSLPRKWKRMTEQQLVYGLRVPNPERMLVLKQVGARAHDVCAGLPEPAWSGSASVVAGQQSLCADDARFCCLFAGRGGWQMGHTPMLAPCCLSWLHLSAIVHSQPSACCQRHGLHGCADLTYEECRPASHSGRLAVCLFG